MCVHQRRRFRAVLDYLVISIYLLYVSLHFRTGFRCSAAPKIVPSRSATGLIWTTFRQKAGGGSRVIFRDFRTKGRQAVRGGVRGIVFPNFRTKRAQRGPRDRFSALFDKKGETASPGGFVHLFVQNSRAAREGSFFPTSGQKGGGPFALKNNAITTGGGVRSDGCLGGRAFH